LLHEGNVRVQEARCMSRMGWMTASVFKVLSEPLGVQTGRQAGAEGILTISHVKLYLTTRRG